MSSSSSSDDSSCNESRYPTISLQPQGLSRSSSRRQDRDVASSSSGSARSRTGAGNKRRVGRKRSDERLRKRAKKQRSGRENLSNLTPDEMKSYKPEECMKYMNLEMHQTFFDTYSLTNLPRELSNVGARLLMTNEVDDPSMVVWSRLVSSSLVKSKDQLMLVPVKQRCDEALYVCNAEEIAVYVNAQTLADFISEKMEEMEVSSLSLVIYGAEDYCNSSSRKANERGNRRNLMTEADLEMAIADVLVNSQCDTIKVNSTEDLIMLLMRHTKAIAESPYKNAMRSLDDRAGFYMRGDNKNCVAVDRDGTGLSRLWQQMLAVLPSSSLEIARALTDKYKWPCDLFKAVSKSEGVRELAGVGVSRTAVPGARSRRIGPEFARKLAMLFTSQTGDMLID